MCGCLVPREKYTLRSNMLYVECQLFMCRAYTWVDGWMLCMYVAPRFSITILFLFGDDCERHSVTLEKDTIQAVSTPHYGTLFYYLLDTVEEVIGLTGPRG